VLRWPAHPKSGAPAGREVARSYLRLQSKVALQLIKHLCHIDCQRT
jgi:hypothetical protein